MDVKKHVIIGLKGIAMGAADVVPGVSGGTIAFISGIYEEFIDSLKSLNLQAIRILFKKGFGAFWQHINGSFLLSLFLGILISFASLAKGLTYLLNHNPVVLWGFFFGLILASIVMIGKQVKQWNLPTILAIIAGTGISYWVTILEPSSAPDSLWFIFIAGFIAIIAMILPGISGSFILLLLGAYATILSTFSSFMKAVFSFSFNDILSHGTKILAFAIGAITGLLSFSRVLSWLFKRYSNVVLALLTGFMIGSLNKIWPWKTTTSLRVHHAGKADESIIPFIQENVWPANYSHISDIEQQLSVLPNKDPQTLTVLLLAIVGIVVIYILEKLAPSKASE
mgnify:CR=1 FL=1